MPKRDIVVIGGSAGSLSALKVILAGLPHHFPASLFVVVHISSDSPCAIDFHLSPFASVPVTCASDGETIEPEHIWAARPDYHLTVEENKIRVVRGPRENRHRPAIDPLFRSAARQFGSRVIGIVLSGLQDDGSAGLYAVRRLGGIAIVQDPDEAAFDEMPRRAQKYANPQYVLPARDIAAKLVELVNNETNGSVMMPQNSRNHKNRSKKTNSKKKSARTAHVEEPDQNLHVADPDEGEGVPSAFACPECHGVLWELKDEKLVRYRCRVGHSYGTESLSKELSQASEAALWAAMRALEEKAALQRRVADNLVRNELDARRLRDQSAADETNANVIRNMIFRGEIELKTDVNDMKNVKNVNDMKNMKKKTA